MECGSLSVVQLILYVPNLRANPRSAAKIPNRHEDILRKDPTYILLFTGQIMTVTERKRNLYSIPERERKKEEKRGQKWL